MAHLVIQHRVLRVRTHLVHGLMPNRPLHFRVVVNVKASNTAAISTGL
jgi:hypothetical protein